MERKSVFKRAVPIPCSSAAGENTGTTHPAASTTTALPVRAKGVRASVFNRNTLTSSGLAALDSALGGGIALGTVVCLIEDCPSECHALLLKHFLAQGLVHGHTTALCSADDDLIRSLPAPIQAGDEGGEGGEKSKSSSNGVGMRSSTSSSRGGLEKPKEEHLKIAWRYKESLSVAERQAAAPSSAAAADYCLRFDLSKTYDASEAALARTGDTNVSSRAVRHVPLWDWQEQNASKPQGLRKVWHSLGSLIDAHPARTAPPSPELAAPTAAEDKVCRIGLSSIGAPMWWGRECGARAGDGGGGGNSSSMGAREEGLRDAVCFMHALKGKVRGSNAVVFASVPHELAAAPEGQRLLRTADYVIRLDSMHR